MKASEKNLKIYHRLISFDLFLIIIIVMWLHKPKQVVDPGMFIYKTLGVIIVLAVIPLANYLYNRKIRKLTGVIENRTKIYFRSWLKKAFLLLAGFLSVIGFYLITADWHLLIVASVVFVYLLIDRPDLTRINEPDEM